MQATPLVSIKPGPGLVSEFDVIRCNLDEDYGGAIAALIAVIENVETALTRRIAALEASR